MAQINGKNLSIGIDKFDLEELVSIVAGALREIGYEKPITIQLNQKEQQQAINLPKEKFPHSSFEKNLRHSIERLGFNKLDFSINSMINGKVVCTSFVHLI